MKRIKGREMDVNPSKGQIQSTRRQMRGNETVETKDFIARPYQIELYEVCKTRNTIVCLNTGGGKTFIAVMLIRHLSPQCLIGDKRTFFLVPLVPLVSQQAAVIRSHTDLRVGEFCGIAYDNWSLEMWSQELNKYEVFVMIDEIFRRILYQGFIGLSQINLLVFDEAHRAVKNHPYREILRAFDTCPLEKQPRILGLSASLITSNASPEVIQTLIRKLEETMRSTCETASDLRTINKYASKPTEQLLDYHPFNMTVSKNLQILKFIADSCISFLEDIDYDSLLLQKNSVNMKTLCKSIKDTLYVLGTMGVWCAQQVARLYIRELSDTVEMWRSTKSHYTAFLSAVLTALNVIEVQLSELLSGLTVSQRLLQYTSPKLIALIDLLKTYNTDSNPSTLCGIIFAERRSVARILCLWLQEISKTESKELSHIRVDFVLGHGGRVGVGSSSLSFMSSRKQEESLKKFRSHECNLLVATSVLEEGLDVPRCNLVVRYDPPKTFREYIQSKGRARAERGKYVIFVERNDCFEKMSQNLNKYKETELILNDCCHHRLTPSEAEIDDSFDDQLMDPYMPNKDEGSARVTLNSAIAIINRYCLKLPSDSFTKLTPQYRLEEQSNGQYVCRLRLPINSQIRHEIISNSMPTKRTAKKAAALKACEVLHKKKELDDNFLPVGKEAIEFIKELELEPPDDEIERVDKGPRPGTTKRRQYYNKLVADVLKSCPIESNDKCFLYEFSMKLSRAIPEEQNTRGRKITDPADTTRNFGVLTTQRVPPICDFPVFTRSGEVTVQLEPIREDIVLTTDQIEKLSVFHKFTFHEVLRLIKYPLLFGPQKANSKQFVVPVNVVSDSGHKDIDWDFVEQIKRHKDFPPISLTPEERKQFIFDANKYDDAVVIPWYRKDKPQFFFYVAEICYNLCPKSPFPDEGYETFEKYYSGKYNIEIMNSTQPLLDVDHTSARLNLLTPRYVNRRGISLPASTAKTKKEKRENLQQKQILVPELCIVHPFPASFWRKAVCLPCLLFRLNSLLVAEQLRTKVAKESSVGIVELMTDMSWPPLDFGWIAPQIDEQIDEINNESKQLVKQLDEPIQEEWDFGEDNTSAIEDKENMNDLNPDEGSDALNTNDDLIIDTFDPNNYLISDDLDDEELDNELLNEDMYWDSDIPINIIGGPNGFSSTTIARNWNFEQPFEGNGVQIREINENNELIEDDNPLVRVGSPSLFNVLVPNTSEGREWVCDEPTTVFPIGSVPELEFISSSNDLDIAGLTKDLTTFPVEDFDSFDGSTDIEDMFSDDEDNDNEELYAQSGGNQSTHNRPNKSRIADILRYELLAESPDVCDDNREPNEKAIKKLYKDICSEDKSVEQMVEQTKQMDLNCLENSPKVESIESQSDLVHLFNEYLTENMVVVNDFGSDLSDDEDLETCGQEMDPFCDKNSNIEKVCGDMNNKAIAVDSVCFGDLLPDRDINESKKPFIENFDPLKSDVDKVGPSPSMVLQALTMSNASDGINLERLETVGDSFLKYSVTAFLYCVCPAIHEGRLSYLRSRQISNLNLYRLGRKLGIGEYMNATKFEPNDNWCPPCYAIPEGLEKALIESNEDNESTVYDIGRIEGINSLSEQQIRDQIKSLLHKDNSESNKKRVSTPSALSIPYNLLTQHSIPDKSIADCVEALIGAYLISSGPRGALLFMKWLDLKVMPKEDVNNDDTNDPIWHWLPTPKSPLLLSFDDNSSPEENRKRAEHELNELYIGHNLDEFERKLDYKFRDKAYLVQAFTHNSYYENQVTDCYQRLEFLGDAVLDYLITRYLYEDPSGHSPGTLTDLRSALVNNTFFASLSVKYKFYKHLKMLSFDLFRVVKAFVNKFNQNDEQNNDFNLFIAEGESENSEDIEVPKALGDIFESVAGAIFLDSGMSLDAVWKVYYKMMKPEIEYFSSNVPKSPIRELLEMEPQNAKFGKPELISGRKIRVCVEVFDFGKFFGVGRNKRIAKCTAAKRALRALKSRKRQLF